MAGVDVVGKFPGDLKAVSWFSAHPNTLSCPERGGAYSVLTSYKEQLQDIEKPLSLPINRIIILIPVNLIESVVTRVHSESQLRLNISERDFHNIS